MYLTRNVQLSRRFIVECLVALLTIVWVAPVTIVAMVVSEQALRSFSPSLNALCERSEIIVSLVQIIQPLAVVLLMDFLPPILGALATLEGCISISKVQMRVFERYYIFQIINVFLVTVIEGSVINCVREILTDPSEAFLLLGKDHVITQYCVVF